MNNHKIIMPRIFTAKLGEKTITENGEYLASADGLDGYSKVTANIGGTPTPEPLNPVYVYKTRRNPEWLNMLGTGYGENYDEMESYYDAADNEIRLLFHLTPPADNLIAFTCTTSSGQYNVSYYDKDDILISVDVNSNTKFEANLMYNDFKHEMSDGTRQVLIVIKPTTIGSDLRTFKPATHSLKTSPSNYMNWTVVEMMGKATSGTSIKPSSSFLTNAQFMNLEFYTLFGTNLITYMPQMFYGCSSLTAIPQLDTSSATDVGYMFANCPSLIAIPQLDTSSANNMSSMFNNTQTLKTLTITATDWAGVSFSVTQCSLGYQALLNLLGSLPEVSGTPTLTATNNIGTAQLAAEVLAETPPAEYTQAVSRGWTIAL